MSAPAISAAAANPVPCLVMSGITKSFPGVKALQGASLAVRAGEALALMGANGAGKSTMMNVLGGVLVPDAGSISIEGKPHAFRAPRNATEAGIAFVHQELTMFASMTVAENIFIDAYPKRGGLIDGATMRSRAASLLKDVGADLSPDMPVEQLGTGDRQLVEIARALRRNARIVILDEPTSSLTERERRRLFDVVLKLKAAGKAVIYITHFLEEIFTVCDRVTVMRDGQTVAEETIAGITPAEVVRHMLGETEAEVRLRTPHVSTAAPVLTVEGMSRAGALRDVSFAMRPGEVLGLWGLLGSGRTELIRGVVGLDRIDAGRMTMMQNGAARPVTPDEVCRQTGLVTEDRRGEGIVAPLSIRDNIALPNVRRLSNGFGIVNRAKADELARSVMKRLSVKASGPDQAIGLLSGGNQQKAVLGRWLSVSPALFFLDEPTRGLDVSAKTDILKLVVELAETGCSVLFVSSELGELMRVADRYMVISRGRIVAELPGSASENDLMDAVA